MSSAVTRRAVGTMIVATGLGGCAPGPGRAALAAERARAPVFRDDFRSGLEQWLVEAERGGSVTAEDGVLDVVAPAGLTVWFRPELRAPISIEYRVRAVSAGGPNDRVSDLNCFWMADDVRAPGRIFEAPRSGAFADYDLLRAYYVGMGANTNTTTRFRRYVGRAGDRPLAPENDLRAPDVLLQPNRDLNIQIATAHGMVRYYRDGALLFSYADPEPYERGWFAFRTTQNHMQVRDFRVCAPGPETD